MAMVLVIAACLLSSQLTAKPIGCQSRRARNTRQVIRCGDGDPSCDRDSTRNGVCRFSVRVCLNVGDQTCPSPEVQSCVISLPRVESARYNIGLARLQTAIDTLRLPRADSICSGWVPVDVPQRKSLGVTSHTMGGDGSRERDRLTLGCLP